MATVFFTPKTQYFDQATANADQPVMPLAQQTKAFEQFTLVPMTAGDIIDRAVRLYRQHFLVFLRVVLAPSLIAYAGGILWAIGIRNFSFERGDQRILLSLALLGGGGVLWLIGKALFLMLLGGASRSLVWHFFDGTPLRARDAYQAVRERRWSLLGATVLVAVLLLTVLMLVYTVGSFALFFYIMFALWLLSGLPQWVQGVAHFLFGALIVAGGALLLLLTYARVVCVPQAMMVEGKNVFAAITRSFQLARGETKRIAVLVLFQFCVAASLYWLLMIPLGWYGYWNGVEIGLFNTHAPLWFTIAQQTLSQVGEILIAPIILLGFTLLYLDTRVRKEGFDVELLANRVLPTAEYTPALEPVAEYQARDISWTETPAATEQPLKTESAFVSDYPSGEFAEVVPLTNSLGETVAQPIHETAEKPIGLRFCSACGTPAEPQRLFCSNCGMRF
jgi:hypothetical protein